MIDTFIKILSKVTPGKLKQNIILYLSCRFKNSFSKRGEDVILNSLFMNKESGFYVDVGAYDPIFASNTYLFYRKGWQGINIDARPKSMQTFQKLRSKDINLEYAIHDSGKPLIYYEVENGKSMNSFSLEFIKKLKLEYRIKREIIIKTVPLNYIFKKYLPKEQKIDFITIDVEGLELNVLRSNDWDNYRPSVVLIESFDRFFYSNHDFEIKNYLNSVGYHIIAKTLNSIFFMEKSLNLSSTNVIINP